MSLTSIIYRSLCYIEKRMQEVQVIFCSIYVLVERVVYISSSGDLPFILSKGLHSSVSATRVTAVSQISESNEKKLSYQEDFFFRKTAYKY